MGENIGNGEREREGEEGEGHFAVWDDVCACGMANGEVFGRRSISFLAFLVSSSAGEKLPSF